jgi:hypothetical protein
MVLLEELIKAEVYSIENASKKKTIVTDGKFLTNCLLMTLVVHNLHGVAADTKSLF